MLQTLCHIPERIAGVPLFGASLLLVLWLAGSIALLVPAIRRQGFNRDTRGHILLLAIVGAVIWLLLPRLSEPGKGIPIRGYGVMLLIAVSAGLGLAVWRGKRQGVGSDLVFGIASWVLVPGIVGARMFYVIEYWFSFYRPPTGPSFLDKLQAIGATLYGVLSVAQGGLVVYGSLIGGLLGLLAFILVHKLPALATFDLLVPSLVLGLAIGRIGCFLNGCCFGCVCHLPWAVEFPAGSPPYQHQIEHGQLALPSLDDLRKGTIFLHGLKVIGPPYGAPIITAVEPRSGAKQEGLRPGQEITAVNGFKVSTVENAQKALLYAYQVGPSISLATAGNPTIAHWRLTGPPAHSVPVHPTQLYSAIDAMLLCVFLLVYDDFRRRDGELLALVLTIYPVTRFFMEMIRTDEPGQFGTSLTIAQWVSLTILVCVVPLWFAILRRPPEKAFPTQRPRANLT